MTSNIEGGEYSYAQEAGGKDMLEDKLGYKPSHFKLDIRFESPRGVVILVETKRKFTNNDEEQLREYLGEERILHPGKKIICILANTDDDRIKVWWHNMDSRHLLSNEIILQSMSYYEDLFFNNNQSVTDAFTNNELIGITRKQLFDLSATCISVRSYDDITIEFENGIIVSGVTASLFLSGQCYDDKDKCVYQRYYNKLCRIIRKNGDKYVVMFEDNKVIEDVTLDEFVKGELGKFEWEKNKKKQERAQKIRSMGLTVIFLCLMAGLVVWVFTSLFSR